MDTPFSDAGFVNIEEGAELFDIIKIDPEELVLPSNQKALVGLAEFVNKHPGEGLGQLRRVAAKQPMASTDLLMKLNSFVSLQKRRIEVVKQLENLDEELSIYL